jgi:outer membrane receptor protein involved in Fe transport
MPLLCPIPRDDTYDLPEGRYRAVLSSARTLLKGTNRPVQQLRLLFAVSIPSLVNKNPMAGRTFNFDLGRRSELRGFLESWLGTESFVNNTAVDFEQLVGRSADVNLIHRHNDGYNRPFVFIEAIHAPGSLQLTENLEPQTIEMPADESDWRMVA